MVEYIKKYLFYLVIFLVGIGAGMLLCLIAPIRVTNKDVIVKTETIVKEIVKTYTPLELAKNTIKIDVPKISIKEYVYVRSDSTTIVYRDSIAYVTLPREYYYTKQNDIEIWHSGIDSRIDSLRYTMRETTINNTYKRKDWNHEVSIYGSIGYKHNIGLSTPVGAEYAYYPKRWLGVGVKAEYDFAQKTPGIYAKMNFRFGW